MTAGLAFLAGMGQGYLDGKDRRRQQERQDKFDAITMEEANARRDERQRVKADREAIEKASAPIPIMTMEGMPETMDNRDVGQAGESPVAPPTFAVGMQQFTDRGKAESAATAQRTKNITSEVERQDPMRGQQLRTAHLQGEAAALQLDSAKRDEVMRNFDQDLYAAAAKGPTGIVDFTNASGASPAKARFQIDPDGKTGEIVLQLPDGTERPSGMRYSNDAAGARNMVLDLSKKVPIEAKLRHYQAEAQLAAATADRQSGRDHQVAVLTETERHNRAMEGVYGQRAEAATAKAAGALERMSEADRLTYRTLNAEREDIQKAITTAQAQNNWDPESPGAKALTTRMNANMLRAAALLKQYDTEGAAAPDPAGLRKPAKGGAGGGMKIPPAEQAARDVDAGKQMVLSEYGGDVARARAGLAEMLDGVKRAPVGEARQMLQSQAARLKAGIDAMSQKPAPAPAPRPMASMADLNNPAGAGGASEGPAASRLDAARAAATAAATSLRGYGSRQRQADPDGFARAQQAAAAAQAELAAAETAYERQVPRMAPSFRIAAP